ncbi:hypothetical protein [Streptomyces sp. NPDC003697]
MIKGSEQPYLPGRRAWIKVRSYTTAEGMIAGATGTPTSPTALLLARYDAIGRLRLIARSTPPPTAVRRELSERLQPAGPRSPLAREPFLRGVGNSG